MRRVRWAQVRASRSQRKRRYAFLSETGHWAELVARSCMDRVRERMVIRLWTLNLRRAFRRS